MKKTLFLIFSILIIISGNSNVSVASTNTDCPTTGTLNGHDWVDLGLPSGTKWATSNVGANSPTAYGDYFAWGEIFTKSEYVESDYTYSDNPTILPASADAATINWGAGWRMPTREEMNELYDNCTYGWTSQNGINGILFTGPNGNSIFLPAAGSRSDSSLDKAGLSGCYWTSSLEPDDGAPWFLLFASDDYDVELTNRYYRFSVRAVCNPR